MEHPLSQFKYCPKCGSAHFEVHNEKSKQCADCGFVYYFNPSSATVALILNERDEQLVCRRAKEPAKGTLDLPGGFIDMTETGEEGVARYDTDLAQHGFLAEGRHIHAVRQGAPQEKAALDGQIRYAVGNEMFVKELHGES